MLEKLDQLFRENFTKTISDLNSAMYIAAKGDDGLYEVPTPVILGRGGTAWTGHPDATIQLNPAAVVKMEFKKFKPFKIIYRIQIPTTELEIALTNKQYFVYLMSKVLKNALSNYKATVGGPEIVRFGDFYCKVDAVGSSIFRQTDGDNLEIRLMGEWASEEEA